MYEAALSLDLEEDCIALAGPLADQHDASGADERAILRRRGLDAAQHPFLCEGAAQERHRMSFQRQARRLVIGQHLLRSEERRVGKEWGSTCRSRGSPYH